MIPDIFWITELEPLRLAVMPKPRSGDWLEDEISGLKHLGVSIVISLLEPHEATDLGLADEQALCEKQGLIFLSFPVADRSVPMSVPATSALSKALAAHLRAGLGVTIHCRAGIGRSSLLASCVMSEVGISPVVAFRMISSARRLPVPDTEAQRQWVLAYASTANVPSQSGSEH